MPSYYLVQGLLQQQQEQEAAERELVEAAAERDAILAALTQQDKDLAQAMEQVRTCVWGG